MRIAAEFRLHSRVLVPSNALAITGRRASAAATTAAFWAALAEKIEQLFGGDREDSSERLYFAAAVRGLAMAPVRLAEAGDDDLSEYLQRAAERMLAHPRRRPA
jgi:hypothetical protein